MTAVPPRSRISKSRGNTCKSGEVSWRRLPPAPEVARRLGRVLGGREVVGPPRITGSHVGPDLVRGGAAPPHTNVVERAIRPVTITRKNSLFAGSDAGARRWAVANTLIQTCKLNGVEPLAYLTDVLQRIVSGRTKAHELHTLLPWKWRDQIRADVPDTAMAA